ncbi:MAG: putative toxin-antitoxin system toxin component, PIN family [Chlamydiae bacterium]|nr:putative toxin-antitoxin system toxin component, PIN family [Chlamydiota bacterium]MBI3277813.1 putative toxin-antitoxin system toxin component, PIN family [Chlamydiota bacterium]
MIKAVIDANVVVSALINKKGTPAKILDHLQFDRFVMVVSKEILFEIRRVLKYPKWVKIHQLSFIEIDEFVNNLETLSLSVILRGGHQFPVRDINDVIYLEAAEVSQADYVVSGDKDLRALEQYHFIPILSPRKFLNLLK